MAEKKYEVEEIEEMVSAATPGEWRWKVDLNSRQITLQSDGNMRQIVMDFVRWGNGAAPRFHRAGLMERGDSFAEIVEGREHHASWFQSLDHPDAAFITAARPIIQQLLDEKKQLQHELSVADNALEAVEAENKRLLGGEATQMFQEVCDQRDSLRTALEVARKQSTRLANYTSHTDGCEWWGSIPRTVCDCGLANLLESLSLDGGES